MESFVNNFFPNWVIFVPTLLACILIVWFLYAKLKDPIGKYFRDKSKSIKSEIENSKDALIKANELAEKSTTDLLETQSESFEIINSANKEALIVSEEMLAISKKEADSIIAVAKQNFESEIKKFEEKQKENLIDKAMEAALKLIEKNIDDKTTKKLVNEMVEAK